MKTIVLASNNANKAEEIQMLLGNQVEIIMQQDLNIEPTPETGKTFQENAFLKATTVYKKAKLPVIGDDSGLEVDCLNQLCFQIYFFRKIYIFLSSIFILTLQNFNV